MECPICLNTTHWEVFFELPCCRQNFHHGCLKRWLELHNTCPHCKSESVELPECPICLNTKNCEAFIETPCCQQNFHKRCLKEWQKEHDTCPYCRRELPKDFFGRKFMFYLRGLEKRKARRNRGV